MKKELIDYFSKIKGKIVEYNKDDIIANEGMECSYIFYIISGEVKAYTISDNDNMYIINNVKEKDIFGDIPLFSSNNIYLGDIVASKKSTIKLISKNEFVKLFKDETFVTLYLNLIDDKFLILQNRLKVLNQKSIKDKLLFYINKRCKKEHTDKIYINSKIELAQYLNVPRPSLSRELINLKNMGLIDYDKHYIKKC